MIEYTNELRERGLEAAQHLCNKDFLGRNRGKCFHACLIEIFVLYECTLGNYFLYERGICFRFFCEYRCTARFVRTKYSSRRTVQIVIEIGDSEFPDTGARTSVGNLPNGSAYLIGNPGFRRMQLCISVSEDGYLFDKNFVIACEPETMKYRGRAKGTGFHYPHSVVAGDYLFVIYSQNKEDIHIAKIPLSELM